MQEIKRLDNLSAIIAIALFALAIFVWQEIFFGGPVHEPKVFFLDVGQGDSTLFILPGNVKILTDAGPSRKVLDSVAEVLARGDRYIDLAIISHPQLDHFNGFNYLLDNYKFGAFIWNGRDGGAEEWQILLDKIQAQKIPLIVLGGGDKIHYSENAIDIISPNSSLLQSAELNDTGLVELVYAPPFKALLAADIGRNVEKFLTENFDFEADVLKVGHHGSKNFSGNEFLGVVSPKISVIQAGIRNRYGHPHPDALSRIEENSSYVFRTDKNGTIEIAADGKSLLIFSER